MIFPNFQKILDKIIEFSQITNVIKDGVSSSVAIEDSNLDNQYISDVLNKYGHVIDIQPTEDGGYELFFN